MSGYQILPVYGEGDQDAQRLGGGGSPLAIPSLHTPSTIAARWSPSPQAGRILR